MDQVQTLAAEGANTAQTASGNASLAQQVNSLLQQFVGLSATRINNRYVFSGNQDQQIPYTYDATKTPLGQRLRRIGLSTRNVQDAVNGATDIPGGADGAADFRFVESRHECFHVAREPKQRARLATTPPRYNDVSTGFPAVSQYLNTQLAFYGNVQDQLASRHELTRRPIKTQQQAQVAESAGRQHVDAIDPGTRAAVADSTTGRAAIRGAGPANHAVQFPQLRLVSPGAPAVPPFSWQPRIARFVCLS